ncbi:polyprenyl synthetase family protein [Candidatus Pelagibacter communis]|uniref:polyprenyl synthetase family protein n=1 Tax=Pelagibacter ubique TaxID=198252 RepID=UPI00094CCBBE|nr:polyprenyl synthetase family protein [Candidatus Pelagibacter ubique]
MKKQMIKLKLNKNAKKIDQFIKRFLRKQDNSLLVRPMKYGVISGGKKIRSKVIFDAGKLLRVSRNKLIYICAAVECIHSYSLIHDDLPCMDNDDLRRGKLSTHKKFGEATAVLAGNSLLTLSFEIISDRKNLISSKQKNEIISLLANCSGHTGIAGGQELDLKFENKRKKVNQIIDMQRKKTGKLFNFCLQSIAILANKNKNEIKNFGMLGEDIGLLFQLADDFLDIKGSKKLIGKSTNKDKKNGKSTLINLLGYKKAYKYAENLKKKILLKLRKHGKNAKDLTDTIEFILGRNF